MAPEQPAQPEREIVDPSADFHSSVVDEVLAKITSGEIKPGGVTSITEWEIMFRGNESKATTDKRRTASLLLRKAHGNHRRRQRARSVHI
jgi:hypothetical protein